MFSDYSIDKYDKMVSKNEKGMQSLAAKMARDIKPWYLFSRILAFGLGFILYELINQYYYDEVFDVNALISKGLRGMLIGVIVLNFNWIWKKIGLGKRD
jgi:hypothetical protein